jgi:predicted acetylornithine/succinylornithine family transaminase
MNKDEIISRGRAAIMKTCPLQPVVIERGEGCYLYDSDGKKYLDFTSGVAVNPLGHSHPAYIAAAKEQVAKLSHLPGSFMTEPKMKLAEALTGNSAFDEVFFCNSGTEANEGALKLARKWAKENKGPDCTEIICFNGSFHGRTFGALSVTKGREMREIYEPALSGVHFAEFNDIDSVRNFAGEKTACIIVEPVQGENGVYPATKGFMYDLRDFCDELDIALIFDEVQTGIGRTGKLFACEHYGIEPDITSLAKGLGNGFPIGAVLARDKFSSAFDYGSHGSTFGGGPVGTRLAGVVVEEVLKPGFLDNVNKCGERLLSGLKELQNQKDTVTCVRGMGLMAGIDITPPLKEVLDDCRENGLLPWRAGKNTMRILPPLVISEKEIDEGLEILSKVL